MFPFLSFLFFMCAWGPEVFRSCRFTRSGQETTCGTHFSPAVDGPRGLNSGCQVCRRQLLLQSRPACPAPLVPSRNSQMSHVSGSLNCAILLQSWLIRMSLKVLGCKVRGAHHQSWCSLSLSQCTPAHTQRHARVLPLLP